jgi:hypothetical protein
VRGARASVLVMVGAQTPENDRDDRERAANDVSHERPSFIHSMLYPARPSYMLAPWTDAKLFA